MARPEQEVGQSSVEIDITIHSGDKSEDVLVEQLLTENAESIAQKVLYMLHIQQEVTLSLMITDDEEIHALNHQYRQQDKPTDVIAFC